MKIGSIPNVSFKSAYAVSGSKKQTENLRNSLQQERSEEKILILPATDMYKDFNGNGVCTRAAREGKQVDFYITGKNIEDVLIMNPGWGSMNGISHHLTYFYEIQDDKKATDHFKSVIQEDWEKDNKDKQ